MTPTQLRLDGKVALVTGGGTGIGRGIALAFAEAGARVSISGRRADVLQKTRKEIGDDTLAVPGDVTRADDRERMVQETVKAFQGLDVLVNYAGAVTSRPVHETDEATWERVLRTNVTAPALLSAIALPHLRRQRGSILNISTGASLHPVAGYAVYGSSKAALNYVSTVLAMEAAPEVRVNVICPGGVETPLFESFVPADQIPDVMKRFTEMTPLGRMGQPEDIASAAVYLTSDAASWVTGAVLTVDGGLNLG